MCARVSECVFVAKVVVVVWLVSSAGGRIIVSGPSFRGRVPRAPEGTPPPSFVSMPNE